jgi:very-short-patch-repair endonuclease
MGRRQDSDEAYVLDLCDEILGEQGSRQHRFDWLLSDPGASGRRVRLPVDSYWPGHRLVVEYRGIQHDQPVPFFDKTDRLTVSGVHRGEQRALYDARRDTEVPAHGLRLVAVRPFHLDADGGGRLRRNRENDLEAIRGLLEKAADDEPRPSAPKDSDEERVVDAFRQWLMADGWITVAPTDPHTDIEAVRGEERLIGAAKGRTKEPGTDADIAYGQLLRRMTDESPSTRYALIMPTASVWHARRVPAAVRRLLCIDLYEVTESGAVKRIDA